MIKTLFLGAMALSKGKAMNCIMAICNSIKVVETDILAKWTSLFTRFLGNEIPAMI